MFQVLKDTEFYSNELNGFTKRMMSMLIKFLEIRCYEKEQKIFE